MTAKLTRLTLRAELRRVIRITKQRGDEVEPFRQQVAKFKELIGKLDTDPEAKWQLAALAHDVLLEKGHLGKSVTTFEALYIDHLFKGLPQSDSAAASISEIWKDLRREGKNRKHLKSFPEREDRLVGRFDRAKKTCE